jgi:hypothetical protein
MKFNVPAVYDVLPARIKALRNIVPKVRGQGWQNAPQCGVGGAAGLAVRPKVRWRPSPPPRARRKQPVYAQFNFAFISYYFYIFLTSLELQ